MMSYNRKRDDEWMKGEYGDDERVGSDEAGERRKK